jgi:hypothetical protein
MGDDVGRVRGGKEDCGFGCRVGNNLKLCPCREIRELMDAKDFAVVASIATAVER